MTGLYCFVSFILLVLDTSLELFYLFQDKHSNLYTLNNFGKSKQDKNLKTIKYFLKFNLNNKIP